MSAKEVCNSIFNSLIDKEFKNVENRKYETEWISVKDMFPEIDGYGFEEGEGISDAVLIYYTCKDDDQEEKHHFRNIAHWYVTKEKKEWTLYEPLTWECIPNNHENLLEVTHWMPLPEPPND